MSYNKLKSLVANVEAIKTALQIHIQGRQATPEEKETLSQYSGFGGIKEVLNIGTDKPVSGDMWKIHSYLPPSVHFKVIP